MSTSIQVINNEQPYRIIGDWSADNGYKGSINYGFDTLDKAKDYMRTLEGVARMSKMDINKSNDCELSVSAEHWCAMANFRGSYRVAQYIN